MINIKKLLVAIGSGLVLIISASVQAQANITPENGWWLNPEVPGRGYAIEVQDNVAFIATFTYDPLQTDGVRRPIWFATAGVLVGDNVFEGVFDLYENGTCVGCPLTQNSVNPTEKHNLLIEFTSDTTGTMTIDGESFSIKRFYFAPSYENPNQRLFGQWHLVMTSPTSFSFPLSTPISGEVLVLDRTSDEEGITYIEGCSVKRVTQAFCNDDDELVIGRYYGDNNQLVLVVNKGSAWRSYVLYPSSERMSGAVDQFAGSGAFDPERAQAAFASRSASKAFVQTGVGPAKATVRPSNADADVASAPSLAELENSEERDSRNKLRTEMIIELGKISF